MNNVTFRRIREQAAFVLIASLLVVVVEAAQQPAACEAAIAALFRTVEQEALGVWVTDDATAIGAAVARQKFEKRLMNAFMIEPGWYPVDGTKRVVCGRLEHWSLYRGPSPELDLHSYIVPSGAFSHILSALPPFGTTDRGKGHVWGEVTPPVWFNSFWAGPQSPNRGEERCTADSKTCRATKWEGQTACIYGPWVMERVYNFRVEIHPAQAVWGKTENEVELYILTDESRRFDDQREYRRPPVIANWRPWARPVNPVVSIAAAFPSAGESRISVQRTTRIGSSRTTVLSAPTGRIVITHAPDLQIQLGPACTVDGAPRAFVAISAAAGAVLQGLRIGGDLATSQSAPVGMHDETSESAEDRPEEEIEDTPELLLQGVEWGQRQDAEPSLLPKTRATWGFNGEMTDWTALTTQRLRLTLDPNESVPAGRFWVDWAVQACDVEAADGCGPVEVGSSADELYIEVSHGRQVAVTVPDHVREARNNRPLRLDLFVRYPRAPSLAGKVQARSIQVEVSATLRDRVGHQRSFRHVLRNIAPDVSADVQQFDLNASGGRLPDRVITWAIGWLNSQGFKIARPEFEDDWSLDIANAPVPLEPVTQQDYRRDARIVRLGLMTFLEDRTLDAEELVDLTAMLRRYASSRASRNDNANSVTKKTSSVR